MHQMIQGLRTLLRRWPMQLLGLLLAIVSIGVVTYTYHTSERVVMQYAIESARTHADLAKDFRNFYTLELVPRAQEAGMAITHEYKSQAYALPLPATFVMDLGHYLSRADGGGVQVSLYSDWPFPWRKKERVLDDFQAAALAHLKTDPDKPYVREEWRNGTRVLRYAQADRMLERCVMCHNTYAGSPRTDWQVGDVRGALEVVIPVSRWQVAGARVLNQSFIVLLGVLSIGLVLIWVVVRRIRLALFTSRRLSIEREKAIQDLQLSEDKLNTIFASVPDGIVVADEAGTIVQCNPAVSEIFGYAPDELLGQNVTRLMDRQQEPSHAGYMQRYLMTGDKRLIGQSRVVQGCRRDGSVLPVRLTLRETRIGKERLFIALIQDYTSVQQTQDLLVQARDRAEQVNRLRGEFLANMSHEIRTPMNGIVGMTELALNTDDEQERKECLNLARDSSHHLLNIINEILDFSKIEAGALELEELPVNPAQLIRDSARALESLAQAKGLALEVHLDPQLPACCKLDPVRVRQILTNLIGNAIKFTQHGRVTVEGCVQAADPNVAIREVRLQIKVSDTGIGFDPERTEALFSPFTQADGSVTRSFGGTGLGLAITRSLVQLMGGTIWAQSQPGLGSQFVVTLPLQVVAAEQGEGMQTGHTTDSHRADFAAAANSSVSSKAPQHEAQSLNVLLVEDHPVNQILAQKLLRGMGHTFVTANNGQEALDHLTQRRFDVVLMDVMMPVVDGLTALTRWREYEAQSGTHTPVIMVTAYAMTGDRERFLSSGADGYVSKPLMPDALRNEIERVMQLAATSGGDAIPPKP